MPRTYSGYQYRSVHNEKYTLLYVVMYTTVSKKSKRSVWQNFSILHCFFMRSNPWQMTKVGNTWIAISHLLFYLLSHLLACTFKWRFALCGQYTWGWGLGINTRLLLLLVLCHISSSLCSMVVCYLVLIAEVWWCLVMKVGVSQFLVEWCGVLIIGSCLDLPGHGQHSSFRAII